MALGTGIIFSGCSTHQTPIYDRAGSFSRPVTNWNQSGQITSTRNPKRHFARTSNCSFGQSSKTCPILSYPILLSISVSSHYIPLDDISHPPHQRPQCNFKKHGNLTAAAEKTHQPNNLPHQSSSYTTRLQTATAKTAPRAK